MGRWTHNPHPRGAEGTVKPRTGKDGRRCGRRRDGRRWRRGWKVRGGAMISEVQWDWGKRDGGRGNTAETTGRTKQREQTPQGKNAGDGLV